MKVQNNKTIYLTYAYLHLFHYCAIVCKVSIQSIDSYGTSDVRYCYMPYAHCIPTDANARKKGNSDLLFTKNFVIFYKNDFHYLPSNSRSVSVSAFLLADPTRDCSSDINELQLL